MKLKAQCCWKWIVLLPLTILIVSGCSEPDTPPTVPPTTEAANTESPTETPTPEPATPTVTPTATPSPPPEEQPASDPTPTPETEATDVLYQDRFKDLASGWPSAEFDNYYIGYHEPEFYHVEVHEPNDDTIVVLPEQEFADVTTEAEVFVEVGSTAQSGDFRYGLVLRRSGNQYYAFMISPTTKAWHVLKNSPTGLEVLDSGTAETIRGLEDADMLRVDANGSIFTFHINGQPVSQVEDEAYATGELGFIVETFDSPRAHIHYDSLTIREAKPPQQVCTVDVAALNLRAGPGIDNTPISILRNGTRLEPLALSPDGLWIQISTEEGEQVGWVAAFSPYVSCNFSVNDLPAS